tara:strand:+ start:749 stop:2830 length:2082 start_codon:yes stop_codon:yes gene_type:complete
MTYKKSYLSLLFVVLALFFVPFANARVVENVDIKETPETMEIKINFSFPLQYIGHVPGSNGDNLRIQFRLNSQNVLDGQDLRTLSNRSNLTWDHSKAVALQEMFWDGGDATSPLLTLLFNRHVDFDVESSSDLRSVTIRVNYQSVLTGQDAQDDQKHSGLLREAMAAFRGNDYETAIRLLTKIEASATGAVHKQALEYLGLTRQRNNQLAHAKAEYQRFLELYPDGPDAIRVQQRLAALTTADQPAQQSLRQAESATQEDEKEWTTSVYGSLSQFYFRDESRPRDGEKRVNVSNLNSDANLNVRARSKDAEIRFQFVGSHQADFLEDRENRKRLSRIFVDYQNYKLGTSIRVGRQSKSKGGVLGRFDGVDVGYEITDNIKVNAVYGHPVQSSRQTNINSDRKFYGASLDFDSLVENWDFTAYLIEQKNKSLLDRRAIGGEARYFKDGKSLFAMVDYDLHFKELNLAMLNSSFNLSEKTSIYANLDYRKSPLLTSTNAIQGQGVENLSDLFDLYTNDEIYLIAADRTATVKTATFGLNRTLSEQLRLSIDLTATDLAGTVSSAGVIGFPGTGTEIYTSLQLLASDLIVERDSHIIGLRYNDRERDRNYTLYFNSRFRIGKEFRLNPRLRLDYKSGKLTDNKRLIIRPTVKMEYKVGKWLYLEFEGGFEYRDETFSQIEQTTTGNYIYTGYRGIF